jgi:hypothetical protein
MAGLLRDGLIVIGWAGQSQDEKARADDADEAGQQALPMAVGDQVQADQKHAHPRQQAAQNPQRRPRGLEALAQRPPEAAEEDRPEHQAADPCQHEFQPQFQCRIQRLIHRHPPALRALHDLL